ncbi:MAG: aminotransferase class I/II-fold pyridoxal phosphate-dependent enzyme [Candidatus Coproplasma sp.]
MAIDLFKKCEQMDAVNLLRKREIYPYFRELQSRQDVEVIMEGKRRIMLGSNNYLGLTTNPNVIEAGVKALEKYGSGCSGSRFLNGTLELHTQLERELAEFVGKEGCMTLSTGFQSNLGIISAICGRGDYIICDRENHASIYDGCKLSYAKMLRFRHSDMEDLERQLKNVPDEAGCLIITDGVFSMSGDICKLPEIVALAKKYGARVMVDDAHGLGVLGNGGRGTADYFGLTDSVDIIMGTFSKSLASIGGFVAADNKVLDYVRHCSRPFIFCASIPPANCATAIAALNELKKNPALPARLLQLADYYRSGLKERGVKIIGSKTPIVAIYTYDTVKTFEVTEKIYQAGVYVNAAVPPSTPEGEALIRTSLMATHTEPILDEAMDTIASVLKQYPEIYGEN